MTSPFKAYIKADEVGMSVAISIVMTVGKPAGDQRHILRLKPSPGSGKPPEQYWEALSESAEAPPTLKLGQEAVTALADALREFGTPSQPDAGDVFLRELYAMERDRVTKLIDYMLEHL